MSQRTIRLLHVEDDLMQQRIIAHHLQTLSEFVFEILAVESEDLAMEAFAKEKFDLIILDYQLTQGDGLHLLSRLRQLDPVIPIIAISGVATKEVAADLVLGGADDYFDKRQLDSTKLATSIRAILLRAETLAKRSARLVASLEHIENDLLGLCRAYVERVGIEPLEKLALVECEIRERKLGAEEFEVLYRRICVQVGAQQKVDLTCARVLLRPLFLDLLFRLEIDSTGESSTLIHPPHKYVL